jgi:hypothetical protein
MPPIWVDWQCLPLGPTHKNDEVAPLQRRLLVLVGVVVTLLAMAGAIVESPDGPDPAYANAFSRGDTLGVGGTLTVSTKEDIDSSVYFSPVVFHNYLSTKVRVLSLSLTGVRGPARDAGLYRVVLGCQASIEMLDEDEPGYGWGDRYHLASPHPFWVPGAHSLLPPCGSEQVWVDKYVLYGLGMVTTTGFDITYQANGMTYRDHLPGVRFKISVIREPPPPRHPQR